MNCATGREKIMDCTRSVVENGCSHELDVIVECINTDYDKPMEPDPGTVRMAGSSSGPSDKAAGRVEVFLKKYGSICNIGFNDKAA